MRPAVIGVVFVSALTVLVWAGYTSASIPVLKVHDLRTVYAGGTVRVTDTKIVSIESDSPLVFRVSPREGALDEVRVVSERTMPENFQVGRDVGLTGDYDRLTNTFTARTITTQCPTKYEASKEGRGEEGPSAGGPSYPGAGGPAPASSPIE
jgi:hypothetical protein